MPGWSNDDWSTIQKLQATKPRHTLASSVVFSVAPAACRGQGSDRCPPAAKMVKAYLRYEHAAAFGVISSGCNVLYDASGKHLYTGALENIAVWNIRQGSLVRQQQRKGWAKQHQPRLPACKSFWFGCICSMSNLHRPASMLQPRSRLWQQRQQLPPARPTTRHMQVLKLL